MRDLLEPVRMRLSVNSRPPSSRAVLDASIACEYSHVTRNYMGMVFNDVGRKDAAKMEYDHEHIRGGTVGVRAPGRR